jgi:hypothetical protein
MTKARRLGVALNRLSLACLAVLALSDVGRGAGAHVTDSLDSFSSVRHRLRLFL